MLVFVLLLLEQFIGLLLLHLSELLVAGSLVVLTLLRCSHESTNPTCHLQVQRHTPLQLCALRCINEFEDVLRKMLRGFFPQSVTPQYLETSKNEAFGNEWWADKFVYPNNWNLALKRAVMKNPQDRYWVLLSPYNLWTHKQLPAAVLSALCLLILFVWLLYKFAFTTSTPVGAATADL